MPLRFVGVKSWHRLSQQPGELVADLGALCLAQRSRGAPFCRFCGEDAGQRRRCIEDLSIVRPEVGCPLVKLALRWLLGASKT